MIRIPTTIIEMASMSFFILSFSTKNSPHRPENKAVTPMITQRMFLDSYMTESRTFGSFGSAFRFSP